MVVQLERRMSKRLIKKFTKSGYLERFSVRGKEKPRCFVMDHSFLAVVLRNGTIAAHSHPCIAPCDPHHGVLLRAS